MKTTNISRDANDPSVLHVEMTVTPAEVGMIVWGMYNEGRSHEEVTAWLEKHVRNFREIFVEVSGVREDDGKPVTVWARPARHVSCLVTLCEP